MAHNINTYIGRQSAWHSLGTVTGAYQTWNQILAHGGLDFVVFKSQLRDGLGRAVDAWGTFRWNLADKAAGAKDKAQFLGAVGKDYTVIQHATGFDMIDALVASQDGAHYETAGALGNGEVVWGLADLNLAARVGDDVQQGYLLFSTSHDSSMSYSYRTCLTRVVCQNTLTSALSEKAKAAFSVRHTKSAETRIGDAHAVIANMGEDIKRIEDKLNFLAGRKLNREALTSIMDRLFPKRLETEDGVKVNQTRRENILADVMKVYELNDGNAFPEQRGSAYNLLNAVTNYTDHVRGADGNRGESALFGSGDRLKSNALEVITLAARDMDTMPAQRQYMTAASSATFSAPVPSVGILDSILAAS